MAWAVAQFPDEEAADAARKALVADFELWKTQKGSPPKVDPESPGLVPRFESAPPWQCAGTGVRSWFDLAHALATHKETSRTRGALGETRFWAVIALLDGLDTRVAPCWKAYTLGGMHHKEAELKRSLREAVKDLASAIQSSSTVRDGIAVRKGRAKGGQKRWQEATAQRPQYQEEVNRLSAQHPTLNWAGIKSRAAKKFNVSPRTISRYTVDPAKK